MSFPSRPTVQGGDYRPHYPARDADAYMDALLERFQRYCRHKWYRHSWSEVIGGTTVSESRDTCEHCGKERQR